MRSLLMLLALAAVVAAAWAALVTLFSPPFTLGFREFAGATIRRWPRNAAVAGAGAIVVFVLRTLFAS